MTSFSRSPSPAPQYDNHGRRVNTREYRYRKRLEDERHKLIEKAMKTIPNYHPPQDYRRPTKTQEKVYVPVNDYPEINFSMIANPLTSLTMPPSLAVWRAPQTSHISSTLSQARVTDQTVPNPSVLLITILTPSSPPLSWLTHRPSWQHSEEDGNRIRRQDCHSWQGLRQRGQRPF